MTSASPQPHRERPLGRPLSSLIPQGTPASAAEQAMASLAAVQSVPVPAGVLQAAVVLLEENARTGEETVRAAAAATAALLRTALAAPLER
ncbi:hypothetical protein [Streptomyces sp. URMC 123]|uniref:hypothetical protein n=1 Tax=Streptomyces sp. URMC 123 TaxID=3423403 RepID=UPI003F1BF573